MSVMAMDWSKNVRRAEAAEAALKEAVEAERERCAAYVEYLTDQSTDVTDPVVDACDAAFNDTPASKPMSVRLQNYGDAIAAAIRARKETQP